MKMMMPAIALGMVFAIHAEVLTGRVITRSGDAVPGIFVNLVGTALHDTTDQNGEYSLEQGAGVGPNAFSVPNAPFTLSNHGSRLALTYGPGITNVDIGLSTLDGRRIRYFTDALKSARTQTIEFPFHDLASGVYLLEQHINGTVHRLPLWYTDNEIFYSRPKTRGAQIGFEHSVSSRGMEQEELLRFYTEEQNIAVTQVRAGGAQVDFIVTTIAVAGSLESPPVQGQTVVAEILGGTVSSTYPIRKRIACDPDGKCMGEVYLRYHPFRKRHGVSVATVSTEGHIEGRSEITWFSSSEASVTVPTFQYDNGGYIRPMLTVPDSGYTVGTVLTWNTSPGKNLYNPPGYSVQIREFGESESFTEAGLVEEGLFLLEKPEAGTIDLEIRVVVKDNEGSALGISDSVTLSLKEPDETIVLLHPRAGDAFSIGETLEITWWANSGVTAVEVHFDSDAGVDFVDIAGETIKPEHDDWGRFRWEIPKEYGFDERSPVSERCVIKVFPYDQGVSSAYSGLFEITE